MLRKIYFRCCTYRFNNAKMKKTGTLVNIDWLTVFMYVILAIIGISFIYATTYSPVDPNFFKFNTSYGRQTVWFGLSVIVAVIIIIFDSKFYTTFSYIIFVLVMLLLIGVLLFGVEIKGSKSWFKFGSIAFQPAELAKFATILALSKYISGHKIDLSKFKHQVYAVAILLIPIILILLQGDVGSMLVFSSLIFLLHREGLQSSYLIIGFGLIFFSVMSLLYNPFILISAYSSLLILFIYYKRQDEYPALRVFYWLIFFIALTYLYSTYLVSLINIEVINAYLPFSLVFMLILIVGYYLYKIKKKWISFAMSIFIVIGLYTFSVDYLFNNVLKQHHRDRIDIILGKKYDPANAGYNLEQSKIAIGSGGFYGKGYLKGTQTMLDYVPEQSTDFIFTSIAEELGFIGSFFLMSVYIFFLLRLIFLAERQRSQFSRIYGYGVVSIFFIHFAINIAMTIGFAPVIGIPLPFISYGGSSLLSFTILLAVFIRLDTQRMLVLK